MKLVNRSFGRSLALLSVACGYVLVSTAAAQGAEPAFAVRMQSLPRTAPSGVAMDYITFDPATGSVWVPAGNTGTVVVIDTKTGGTRLIDGQPTAEMTRGERKFTVGPSSVTIGDGSVYVGNRADSSVCAFDPRSLAKGNCHRLDSMPDGLAYVAATKEVWVTTPRDKSIRVLDASSLAEKAKLAFEGNPEGFAVDLVRSRFYTNLEDKDHTLAIDLATRKTVATWNPACGEDGPHGLRADAKAGWLFVACSTRAEVLDVGHDGKVLSSIDTGDGVDDIDYAPTSATLYVGAAKAGQLTVARADAHGKLSLVARIPTHAGARNPAVTDKGVVYLAHSAMSGLSDLVVVEPKKQDGRAGG
jgi:DNA-binding beta-propeller fold protein YncE